MTDPEQQTTNRWELGRRLRAARELAGYESAEALAEAIGERGLGPRTIRNIEVGNRPFRKSERRTIAEACSVPAAWFEVPDLGTALQEGTTDQLDHIESMLGRVLALLEGSEVPAAGALLRAAATAAREDSAHADKPGRAQSHHAQDHEAS